MELPSKQERDYWKRLYANPSCSSPPRIIRLLALADSLEAKLASTEAWYEELVKKNTALESRSERAKGVGHDPRCASLKCDPPCEYSSASSCMSLPCDCPMAEVIAALEETPTQEPPNDPQA